ncbi:hypothetical protein PK98_15575 [Croceibacterium mercuriale]|uniref:Uncharacterized protein n=1 Tax=Croceibacterium mercuriale TaxID=1572751 RepID=A0A0B2BVV2_9SPHN|nr:hypothetical protein PK98_15575 [Croceibacterium mercuriale]
MRRLTDEGIDHFREYIERIRNGAKIQPPSDLLTDPVFSEPVAGRVMLPLDLPEDALSDRFRFGIWLRDLLAPLQQNTLPRDYHLWNWLSLRFFDQLCAAGGDDIRRPRRDEAYILDAAFSHTKYYRHLVRMAWMAVSLHGEYGKILLKSRSTDGPPLAGSGEIVEQLASRQSLFGNATLIEGAYRLYFSEDEQRPRKGAGGSGAGSPRRLATIVQQLDLTYDLRDCTPEQFIELLPKEFNRWKLPAEA